MRPDILTATGEYVNYLSPQADAINIFNIAHGLSNTCRFAGQCREFYSVAQHSVLVSLIVPEEHAFAALMHDAAEAFICDIPKPLKILLPDYQEVEKRVEKVVLGHFGINTPLDPCIKRADLILLATEQRDLMPVHDDTWTIIDGVAPLVEKIVPLPPPDAFDLFMRRVDELLKTSTLTPRNRLKNYEACMPGLRSNKLETGTIRQVTRTALMLAIASEKALIESIKSQTEMNDSDQQAVQNSQRRIRDFQALLTQ